MTSGVNFPKFVNSWETRMQKMSISTCHSKLVTLATRKSNFSLDTFLWILCCIWSRKVASLLYGSFNIYPCVIAYLLHCPLEKSNFATNTFLWILCRIWDRQVASLLFGSFHVCPCVIANLSHCPLENQILQPILFCECFVPFGAGKWLLSCMDPFMSLHV